MFTTGDRDRAKERVLALAESDERVVDGRMVGSLATGGSDAFSDLDLTFAVAEGIPVLDVLDDWSRTVEDDLGGLRLFDLPSGVQRGLPARYGRGFDDLPGDLLGRFEGAIVRSLERDELLRALRVAVDGLLHEGDELPELRTLVEADTLP